MRFHRRQLLRILPFAFWSSFIWGRNQLVIAAQTAAPVAPGAPTVPDSIGAKPVRAPAGSVASSNQARAAPNDSHTAPPEPFWLAVSRQALGTALGGLIPLWILYLLVHKYQRQNERQKLLHELAKEFERIASTECVTGLGTNGLSNEMKYRFTVALNRQVPWMRPPDVRHDFSTGDRRLFFASDPNGLVSASVLHEALFWFRRIDRAHKVKLLSDADLYQMWRQVLPFVTDARYSFLKRYFGGPRQSAEDTQAVLEVAAAVLRHCRSKRLALPIRYLVTPAVPGGEARVDQTFLADLSSCPSSWRFWLRRRQNRLTCVFIDAINKERS